MIKLFDDVDIFTLPLSGMGREAERRAVATLFADALGSAVGHYPDGAPYAVDREELSVSVSHGAGMAILAVCRTPGTAIGIDIESTGRTAQLERVRARFVDPEDEPTLSLLRLWTAKEAVYKASRQPGLPLTAIAVTSTASSAPDTASAATPDGRTFALAWHLLPSAILCLARTTAG